MFSKRFSSLKNEETRFRFGMRQNTQGVFQSFGRPQRGDHAHARCARVTQEKYCAFARESRACALRARDVGVSIRARERHARKKKLYIFSQVHLPNIFDVFF